MCYEGKYKRAKGQGEIKEVAILVVEEVLADKRFGGVRETCQYMGRGEIVFQAEGRRSVMINSFI